MEIMIHLRQRDRPLEPSKYAGIALLLADAVAYYEKIGFAKYVGTALNPTMDTFALVESPGVAHVKQLIAKIEQVPEVQAFLGSGNGLDAYMEIRILPMMAAGQHAGGKGRTTVEEACKRLKDVIDNPNTPAGTLHDAKEEYDRLNCDRVLDPLGGGGSGGPGTPDGGGITPGGGWPVPV